MVTECSFIYPCQTGQKFSDMWFEPPHDAERYAFCNDPDAVENTDIDSIGNVREKGPEGYGIILNGQYDAVDSEVQCSSNRIFKVSEILSAERDMYTDKFILSMLREIFQPLYRLPETAVHLRNMVIERGVRSPEFYLKKRTPCMDNPLQRVHIREYPSVREEFDPPVPIDPGSMENVDNIVSDSRFTTIKCNAVSFFLIYCGCY
jgi:hypothetical protein